MYASIRRYEGLILRAQTKLEIKVIPVNLRIDNYSDGSQILYNLLFIACQMESRLLLFILSHSPYSAIRTLSTRCR
jgi:hypothetical protein